MFVTLHKDKINKEYYKLVSLSSVYDQRLNLYCGRTLTACFSKPTNLFGYTNYLNLNLVSY